MNNEKLFCKYCMAPIKAGYCCKNCFNQFDNDDYNDWNEEDEFDYENNEE